jgi:ribonuclease HI
MRARLFTDGGARGNPGPAAYGFVLESEDGDVLASEGGYLGVTTNNVAEYSGLVAGLRKATEAGIRQLEVISDSELMVKQMLGEYRVRNAALLELNEEAMQLARRIERVEYRHVKRAHNELADKLVNEVLDAAR